MRVKINCLLCYNNVFAPNCRFFLFGGIVMAILGVGNFILFCFAFSLASVTGFKHNPR